VTPAERAVAWGLGRLDGPTGYEGWRTRAGKGDLVLFRHPGKPWVRWHAGGRDTFDTEDAALTAYLDAVGAP